MAAPLPFDYFSNYADDDSEDKSYEKNWRNYGFQVFEMYLKQLKSRYIAFPKSILEVGSADGSVMRELTRRGFTVRGIESNLDMYKRAGLERSRITYGDAVQIVKVIPNNSFDCVFETAAQYIDERSLMSYFKNLARISQDLVITLHTVEEDPTPHKYQKNHQSFDWWVDLLASAGFKNMTAKSDSIHLYWFRRKVT